MLLLRDCGLVWWELQQPSNSEQKIEKQVTEKEEIGFQVTR